MEKNFRKIAVLTSGGDAPGMNAAVRAVVYTGLRETRINGRAHEVRDVDACGKGAALGETVKTVGGVGREGGSREKRSRGKGKNAHDEIQ